ncbi:response regulator receiver protein, partial [Piptocephalis cylindrospora]
RALIVEDNGVNRMILTTFLSRRGIPYDEAVDGAEGVAAYAKRRYDVVLMDIQMPVMDGNTATRHIRRIEKARGEGPEGFTKIWALTGLSQEKDQTLAFEAGVDAFLTKPVKLKQLHGLFQSHFPKAD